MMVPKLQSLVERTPMPNDADHFHSPAGAYVFTLSSLIFLLITAVLFGKRIEQLRVTRWRDVQPIRVYIIAIYAVAMFLVVGLSTLLQAAGLTSPTRCSTGILICLVGYLGIKILLYMFLVERLHALNYRTPRRKDKYWVFFVAVVIAGFGAIAATAFATPVSQYSEETGKCRMGLSVNILIALLGYDLFINVILTGLFVHLLISPLRFRYENSTQQLQQPMSLAQRLSNIGQPKQSSAVTEAPHVLVHSNVSPASTESIERLLQTSLTGLLLILLPTIVNLAILLKFQGHEPGWLCFTLCQADVTFQVVVVHCMTRTPLDLASKINLAPQRPSTMIRMHSADARALPPAYHPFDDDGVA